VLQTDRVRIDRIVVDQAIYPRSGWMQATVDRYADALASGEEFPPIILERDSYLLLDGMHRYQAHRQAGIPEMEAYFHEVPPGVPAKLYAASLAARHGNRIDYADLARLAQEIVTANPDYNIGTIARYCGVHRQTASKWVRQSAERHRLVRKTRALVLRRTGWTQQRIGRHLGVDQSTIMREVEDDNLHSLTEDILTDALTGLPDECRAVAEEIRQERIFAKWPEEERALLARLCAGETVVVSFRRHGNLIAWAQAAGKFVRIDRQSQWGNQFEMPGDGDRETVIRNFREHYLPYKPSLQRRLSELRGKALGCWCAPEPCHGDVLKEWSERANGEPARR
jgi:transposase-like protein